MLVCRVSGIPYGIQTNYKWTCPNEPCERPGYLGRKITNNIIAINITSTRDGGTYTCNVTSDGTDLTGYSQYELTVSGTYNVILR